MPYRPDAAAIAPQTLDRAVALPPALYTEPGALAFEQAAVFAAGWQLVAHGSQLAQPGDHVVSEIVGVPLILVHGEDGTLRALHNVCRHRAGPLADCDGRGAKALRCRYHGWTYGLDGQLLRATEMSGAADFDVGSIRLGHAELRIWRGLVFVALRPSIPFDDFIAPVDVRVGGNDFTDHVFERRMAYEADCNWKVYVDNYLEGYHLPHVHPGLNKLLDYRRYAIETGPWHSLQMSPLSGDGDVYVEGEALYFFLWPNTMLNILPGRLQTNRVVPLGPDRCRIDFDYSYPASIDPAVAAQHARDQAFSDEVQLEDGAICAMVQRGLASGVYRPGRLNPARENAVFHFHELVRSVWRDAADEPAAATTMAGTG